MDSTPRPENPGQPGVSARPPASGVRPPVPRRERSSLTPPEPEPPDLESVPAVDACLARHGERLRHARDRFPALALVLLVEIDALLDRRNALDR